MKRLTTIAAVLATLLPGVAWAQTRLAVADAGTYQANDVDVAFMSFAMDGDVVRIAFDGDATNTLLPAITFAVPDVYDEGAPLRYVQGVTVRRVTGTVTSVSVTHQAATLAQVAAGYVDALRRAGLDAHIEGGAHGNLVTVTHTGAGDALTVKLHRQGPDVTAYLWIDGA